MFTAETQIRVRYAETDQMGVVYHSNFFPYFESARAESIRQLGFTYGDMERMGVIMPGHQLLFFIKHFMVKGRVILYFVEAGTMKKTTMPPELLKKPGPYFD